MFVEQQQDDREHTQFSQFSQSEHNEQGDEQGHHHDMKRARDPESRSNAGVSRNGMEPALAVEIEVPQA